MNQTKPLVTIAVPVRNGARFLRETLDSLLDQTYPEFELIISDNASTDQTEAICRAYAARDERIRYYRNDEDLGVARNCNYLFQLARGEYFKWAAADDLCEANYLAHCMHLMEQDPTVVLAYAKARFIDENGSPLDMSDPGFNLQSPAAHERLRYVIQATRWVNAIFGVIRVQALAKTHLFPGYPGGDYPLLGELALSGKFVEIPEVLFVRRLHPDASSQNTGNTRWLMQFWNGNGKICLPLWNRSLDHLATIAHSELSFSEKTSLAGTLIRTMISGRRRLLSELKAAVL